MTVPSENPKQRLVSGSEAIDFAKCETLWKFKYHPKYRLAALSDGVAVTTGITGHAGLEKFYQKIMDGEDWDTAAEFVVMKLAEAAIGAAVKGDAEMSQMYADLGTRLKEYFEYYRSDMEDWEILYVESKVEATDDNIGWGIVGRLDMIIRYRRGPLVGQLAVVDHKFVYNFWNDKVLAMSPQATNYPKAVRIMFPGEKVAHFLANEIRYRMNADTKFRRTPIEYSPIKNKNVARNHAILARRINRYAAMDREEVAQQLSRTMSRTSCEYCKFHDLCDAELQGTDTRKMEEVFYRPNTYGYKDDD